MSPTVRFSSLWLFALLSSSPWSPRTRVLGEVMNCAFPRCGPCQVPNQLCELNCIQYEGCMEAQLTCQNSGDRLDFCRINCNRDKACIRTKVLARSVYTELEVNCRWPGSCEGAHIYAAPGSDVFINCDGDHSCTDLILSAEYSKDVFIQCIGEGSCENLKVFCGSGSCLMNCLNNLGGVCSGMQLGCGRSPKCQINCVGVDKCQTIQVDVSQAIGFQCFGNLLECQDAPAPFMLPTKTPTVSPTPAPTAFPTRSPTPAPTGHPTPSPTPSPTDPTQTPTLRPTRLPTHSPTYRPTTNPTKRPTPSPTPRPTDNPTIDPTDSPTVYPTTSMPTADPSAAPTAEPSERPTLGPQFVIILNTGVDSRDNAVLPAEGGLEGLGSTPTESYLVLTCIIIGACICCCVPTLYLIYCKVKSDKSNILQIAVGRRKNKKMQNRDDDDEDDDEDMDNLPPAPPNKVYGDMEGDEVPPNPPVHLQRIASKSVTRDGMSSQFGFGTNGGNVTVPLALTNSRPLGTNQRSEFKSMQSINELEYGHSEQANDFMSEAEMTQNIVKVSIWFIENVQLPQYCELFVLNGYTSMELIQSIRDMQQLELLGIERADHRYQIMREISLLGPAAGQMPSDSDELLEDGRYDVTGNRVLQRGAKKNRYSQSRPPPPAPGPSYGRKQRSKGQSRTNELLSPKETLGIPPEFADRVKVIEGRDGDQIWQIQDVMDQDLVVGNQRRKKMKNKARGRQGRGKAADSRESKKLRVKNRSNSEEEDGDEDESDMMLEMAGMDQNQSISDSSLFRAFRNNLIE